MYQYSYDRETGGLLLSDDPQLISKEPRPVYAYELDLLGFNEHWSYKSQNDAPYMWAESNSYIYRGKKIAQVKGGSLYEKPALEVVKDEFGDQVLAEDEELVPVDLKRMSEKNGSMLQVLEQMTVKKIYEVYKRREKQLDCFHVAFSGGKDSVVLLDLVKKALPKNGFIVLFGDTGMEFPDTYDLVDKIEAQCKGEQITFARVRSHFKPEESWRLFGPPSRTLRWCCTVHKAAPQTIKLREMLGKDDFVGLDFVGVRAEESEARSQYEYENYGKKQKGQYSYNPILEWSSAEVWLYIYCNGLVINAAYKKGNSRAGCLFCPMGSGGKADWFRKSCYPSEVERFERLIKETVADEHIDSYISNCGWTERKNGRDIAGNVSRYREEVASGKLRITLTNPKTDWHEWVKTLGEVDFPIDEVVSNGEITITVPEKVNKTAVGTALKNVLHKACSCVQCGVCQANCKNGCIDFSDGVRISNCKHCGLCHAITNGCLAFDSLRIPIEGRKVMSLNTFADHAPMSDWVRDFMSRRDDFLADSGLGPMQITKLKRFLSDAELITKGKCNALVELLSGLGWDSGVTWAIILTNLANNNPQVRWYVDNMNVGVGFKRVDLEAMLVARSISPKDSKSIVKAFKRLCDLPLGTVLKWGVTFDNGRQLESAMRTTCSIPDESREVVLYALYKFAEKCGGYYQFTLSRIMDFEVESDGVSPAKLFGLDRDTMRKFVEGLAAKHPEFIEATFTHDLDKISLRTEKKSADVLELI